MLSFEVYIVDVAQKLQKLKFFAFFAQIVLKKIFGFFSAFCKKTILKMALMAWK